MLPLRIQNANCSLGKSQDQYMTLHCRFEPIREGVNTFTSLWELTPVEKAMFVEYGAWLWVGTPIGDGGYDPMLFREITDTERQIIRADGNLILTVVGTPHAPPICPAPASVDEVPRLEKCQMDRGVASFVAPSPVSAEGNPQSL